MAAAGEIAEAGRIPGERIATTEETSASSAFTSETVLMSVTATLVSGRTYRVTGKVPLTSSVSNDEARAQIREDNISGTVLDAASGEMSTGTSTTSNNIRPESEYTAVSTGSKTFVVTGERVAGTGNITMNAATTRKGYLYVDYIRG